VELLYINKVPFIEELLSQAGVSRICPIGAMQTLPFELAAGGRPELPIWCDG
jgi:hypothetical protein